MKKSLSPFLTVGFLSLVTINNMPVLTKDMALVDYVLWILILAGAAAALFVHWLSWFIRLRYLSVAVGFGLVGASLLALFSGLMGSILLINPNSGADGAYVWQTLLVGLWAIVLPVMVIIGTLQARSLSVIWWKGALSMYFEAGLGLVILAGFNYLLHYIRLPETGLSDSEYLARLIVSFAIGFVGLAVIRPIIRMVHLSVKL